MKEQNTPSDLDLAAGEVALSDCQILGETAKAFHVAVNGETGYIAKSKIWTAWSDETSEDVDCFDLDQLFKPEEKKEVAKMVALPETQRESEKAIAVALTWTSKLSHEVSDRGLIWFPKSQICDNQVPKWLMDAKISEIMKDGRNHANYFQIG